MKLKVAILEDNKHLLKELKTLLEETKLVEVIVWDTNAEDFIIKVKSNQIDALILDIDLQGDSMNGIDVANLLKLPVLFVSGKTGEFYKNIEELNFESEAIVEHITKPITSYKLEKILPKFSQMIAMSEKSKYVYLDFKESKSNKIPIESIVYMATGRGREGLSNNKEIYFTDRKSEKLIDFSFTKMQQLGLEETTFIQISRSHRVNKNKILCYHISNHTLEVNIYEKKGKSLNVSENYRKLVRKYKP